MKSREAAARLKRFEADEKARKVAELEHMIREFEGMASDLDRQVIAEEERTGVKDPAHFAYSTFARSASQRRDNLNRRLQTSINRDFVARKTSRTKCFSGGASYRFFVDNFCA